MANIKDVAKLANVSVATVSRVINNKGYVNEQTKILVLEAIEELNYIPNEVARSLYHKSSKTIGIILPNLKNEIFNETISNMEAVILEKGYKTMLCTFNEDKEREKNYMKMFKTNKIDGLIVCTKLLDLKTIKQLNIPIVTIECKIDPTIPSITSDNKMGGYLAAKKLIESNCKKILQLSGPAELISSNERVNGFLETLAIQEEIKVQTLTLSVNKDSSDLIFKTLKENPDIDGIFSVSDYIAVQALKCLKRLNRKIPEDVRLIGYDNISICEVTSPTLSTIAPPIKKMGETAIITLFKLIENQEIELLHKKLTVEFIKREST